MLPADEDKPNFILFRYRKTAAENSQELLQFSLTVKLKLVIYIYQKFHNLKPRAIMGNCTAANMPCSSGANRGIQVQNDPQGRPISKNPSTPRDDPSQSLETKGGPRILSSARGPSSSGNIPYTMGSSPFQKNDPDAAADGLEERKQFVREKVFNREERYQMITHIITHLKNDDYQCVSNCFEQYENQNMGFIINQDQELYLQDGEDVQESMYGWSMLEVCLASKATKTAIQLMKNKNLCVMPRADLSDPSLQTQLPPHIVDNVDELLDLEIRPLRACIIAKDYKMMRRVWRKQFAWDACHFYRLIDILFARQDMEGLSELTSHINYFITHFYEPTVLKSILDDNLFIPQKMREKVEALINHADPQVDCPITQWESVFNVDQIGDWDAQMWNARAIDVNHRAYLETLESVKQVIDQYQIQTEIEGYAITPLHYLFAKCIQSKEKSQKLIDKMQSIDHSKVKFKALFKMTKVSDDPREIEADSFLDGGVFLLWCLRSNRSEMLNHLLGEKMIQFWRFAQLKTLAWACFSQKNHKGQLQDSGMQVYNKLMRSHCMQSNYVQLSPQQKVNFCKWMFEVGQQNIRAVTSSLCVEPYSTAFICQTATEQTFKEYGTDSNWYAQFSDACDHSTLYELDQMSSYYYARIRDFIGFLATQDPSTVMQKSGMKLVELCKMTISMAQIEDDSFEVVQPAVNQSVSIGYASMDQIVEEVPAKKQVSSQKSSLFNMPQQEKIDGQPEVAFQFQEFKQALTKGDEVALYHALVSSNLQKNAALKVPIEAIFTDWMTRKSFTYWSQNQNKIGINSQDVPVPHGEKGVLDLSDCNLIQRMIAKGLDLEKTIKYLLETFTVPNSLGQMKVLPSFMLILNKHPNFNKGINKILKMISMRPGRPQDISAFIISNFPVGTLSFNNVCSFFRFLVKVSLSHSAQANPACIILRDLYGEGFFQIHLESFSATQVITFNAKVSEIKSQMDSQIIDFVEGFELENSDTRAASDDLHQELINQIDNKGNCYNTERFLELLRLVSGSPDGGWDAKIRFPSLSQEELCPGQLEDCIVTKSDCGPILLAIKASNAKAIRDLIANDKAVNLRESLRGPIDIYEPENELWRYEFISGELQMPFKNLGFALLADREPNDKQSLSILATFLKQLSFVPEYVDFESIVTVCRSSGRILMLKNFLQAHSIQCIFSSYPYDAQRRIARLLIGLTSDGQNELFALFDAPVTLKSPYQLLVLSEVLENGDKISQVWEIVKDMLATLTEAQMLILPYHDKNIVHTIVNIESMYQRIFGSDDNDSAIIKDFNTLVTKLKDLHATQEVQIMTPIHAKKRTLRGTIAPHRELENHPQQKVWNKDQDMDDNLEISTTHTKRMF